LIKLKHPGSLVWAALWLVTMQSLAQEQVIDTMILTNEPGSECPTTSVRVESVVPDPNTNRQHLVISIPDTLLLNTPNITFHFIGLTGSPSLSPNFKNYAVGKTAAANSAPCCSETIASNLRFGSIRNQICPEQLFIDPFSVDQTTTQRRLTRSTPCTL